MQHEQIKVKEIDLPKPVILRFSPTPHLHPTPNPLSAMTK